MMPALSYPTRVKSLSYSRKTRHVTGREKYRMHALKRKVECHPTGYRSVFNQNL